MTILCLLLMVIEPEVYLCNPVSTPYGIVLTNNYCNNLYLLTEDGLKEIYSAPGCGRYYSVSYDKRKIGFKIIKENGLQIPAIYDLKTNKIENLYSPVYQAGQISFSKDGKIAFTIGEELFIQNNKETKKYRLGVYANLCPISPDGNFMVFNDDYDQLWLLNLTDNSRIRFTDNKYGYCYTQWSPDSRFIAYSTLGGFIKVYDRIENRTYDIDEGKSFNWSPDSRYLIYYKTYTDGHKLTNSELFMSNYDGSTKNQLTNTPDIYEMDPSFVDSKNIIYHTFDREEIIQAEIEHNKPINSKILFKSTKPLKINYYNISSDFGSRDSIDVPYVHQVYDTPDWHNGHASCAPTTAIMAIAYYRKLPYWDCWCSTPYGHTSHFGNYICAIYNYREVTYNWVAQDWGGNDAWGGYGYMWYNGYSPYSRMYNYLTYHALNSWIDDSPTWEETQAEVSAGWPYCMCVGLTTAGHLVLAVGQVLNWHTLIFNDPYGNKNTPGYPSYDGKYARYDWPGYNNGYQNLNSVYWCRGARGSWPAPVDTIVDDLQIRYPNEPYGFYMFTDSPSTMRFYHDNLSGYNGHFWWTYTTISADTCYVTWTPHLPSAGTYEVLAYIPSTNATANARYRIYYAGGNTTVTINQNNYSNQWVSLGIFPFNTTGGYVYLGDASGTSMQRIAFDAMRWHYVGQAVEEVEKENIEKVLLLNSMVKNTITLRFNLIKNTKIIISIFDITGAIVYLKTANLPSGESIQKVDAQSLSSGVYFIKVTADEVNYMKKIIKIQN
ncbi:MAG: T9SS type A sorting domain-containing protein [candidate division WOR-3 bacterium]